MLIWADQWVASGAQEGCHLFARISDCTFNFWSLCDIAGDRTMWHNRLQTTAYAVWHIIFAPLSSTTPFLTLLDSGGEPLPRHTKLVCVCVDTEVVPPAACFLAVQHYSFYHVYSIFVDHLMERQWLIMTMEHFLVLSTHLPRGSGNISLKQKSSVFKPLNLIIGWVSL